MQQKIKILQIIGGGEFGGAEQHLITLLKALNHELYEVEVVCLFPEPLARILAEENIRHRVLPMSSKLNLGVILELSRYIEEKRFDIIHTHGVRANLLGRLAAKKAGIDNVVTTVHSVMAYDYPRKLDLWVNWLSEKLTHRITKQFIAVSNQLAEYVRDTYNLPKRKVSVVHNCLDLTRFKVKGNAGKIRRELGLTEDDLVIVVISRLHPVKGHSILFYAFQQIINKLPSAKLLLVGDGPEEEKLKELVDELGIARAVKFAGFRKDIVDILAASDILALPSLSEGLPLTLLEGMAMKRPVVASKVGGIPEVIKDRVNGLLVTPGDPIALEEAITSLWELPSMAKNVAETGRKTVEERFSANVMAKNTEEVYQRLVERQMRKMRRGKNS